MQSAKDMAASAKAGMEKTKAALQEKGEKMTTRDPLQKEMATEKKEQRMTEAEREKWEAQQRNAAAAGGGVMGGHTTGGVASEYTEEDDMDVVGGGGGRQGAGRTARGNIF